MKTTFLVSSLVLMLSATVSAQSDGPVNSSLAGKYNLGKCRVSVSNYGQGKIEVRVDEVAQYGSLIFDSKDQELLSINTCNSSLKKASQLMESSVSREGGKLTYNATCGGRFYPYDSKVSMTVNERTGRLTAFSIKVKIAKYSLPNGMNSGPIKDTTEEFSCL